jgi:hypothetical protein
MTISNPVQQMLFDKFLRNILKNISPAHPIVVEMMGKPILVVGTLYCFMLHALITALGWQAISNRKFCLRLRALRLREKPLLSSSVT